MTGSVCTVLFYNNKRGTEGMCHLAGLPLYLLLPPSHFLYGGQPLLTCYTRSCIIIHPARNNCWPPRSAMLTMNEIRLS